MKSKTIEVVYASSKPRPTKTIEVVYKRVEPQSPKTIEVVYVTASSTPKELEEKWGGGDDLTEESK